MTHLPLELCNMIVSHFADDRRTLLSLILVSRNFLNEACRLLYHSICIHMDSFGTQLPLSNPTERTYYASLVRTLTIDSHIIHPGNLRRVLCSTVNLEELHFAVEMAQKDVLALLRPHYPFRLKTLKIHARLSSTLLEFFNSQPSIQTLTWNTAHSPVQYLPSHVDLLPNLTSFQTWGSAILDSPWFMKAPSIRHLWISAARGGYVDLHRRSSGGSQRLVSLRLHKFMQRSQLAVVPILSPNLRYLDARYMDFSDLKMSLASLYSLKKLWIYWCSKPMDVFTTCPSLEYVVVGAKGSAVQHPRDGTTSAHVENGDREWMEW